MNNNFVSTNRLLRALSNNEFEPYLQPIVSASDLTVSGAELLVRWHMPTGKVVPPAHFINQAGAANILLPLTKKLLSRTVEFLTIKSMLTNKFRLAVNVTPAILADTEFTQMCLDVAKKNRIHLILELTEQQPFCTDKQTVRMLKLLNNAGIEFALDDFLTGFSVLLYLKDFPINYIKIDKALIDEILNKKISYDIVEYIVLLAKKIGVATVAEGVETEKQVNCLKDLKVDYYQGFYFGKPREIDAFFV